MMQLPNGCSCSKPSVSPKNWEKLADMSKDWRIHYRFYDPAYPNPKQVTIKGMNGIKDPKERRINTKELLNYELHLLLNEGYNPITKKCTPPLNLSFEIDPHTPFIKALEKTLNRLKIEAGTKRDISYVIAPIKKAAIQLDYFDLPIKDIKRRHIKQLLEQCAINKGTFSANTFNHYRKYLSILFTELVELDAIEHNPILDIRKQQTVKKIRETLTDEERKIVNERLQKNYPEFHRFLHIFFHSGGRITELMNLKGKDVDLSAQRYKCIIKKGQQHREVWRTIKNIALPLWSAAMEHCSGEDYLFSEGLLPGSEKIRVDQITKRWYRLIKKERVKKGKKFVYVDREYIIGGQVRHITADFYSLKHLHTSEVIDLLGDDEGTKAAAEHNSHTSEAMVVSIYDVRRENRKHNKLKRLGNAF